MSHADFQPSGLVPPRKDTSAARWTVTATWAYSSRWNNRRLEHHFHVVPQYQIDSINKGPAGPNDSIATEAQKKAVEFTPDFSIVKSLVVPRGNVPITIDAFPITSWNDFTVKAFTVPCIAELKRPPSRRSPSLRSFLRDLDGCFGFASASLEKQVENAFAMQSKNVDKVIMVACVGEWWSWKIAKRESYIFDSGSSSNDILLPSLFAPGPSEKPPRSQPPREAKNDDSRRKAMDLHDEPIKSSDKLPYSPRRKGQKRAKERSDHAIRYTDLGHEMEPVKEDVEEATPIDDEWSGYILLGSPASNQRLFLIHRFLSTECTPVLGDFVRPSYFSNFQDVRLINIVMSSPRQIMTL